MCVCGEECVCVCACGEECVCVSLYKYYEYVMVEERVHGSVGRVRFALTAHLLGASPTSVFLWYPVAQQRYLRECVGV